MNEMVPALVAEIETIIMPDWRAARHVDYPQWEAERMASMKANLGPGDTLIDIGSECGDLSAANAKMIGYPGGLVLIDANVQTWPTARAIWEANDLPAPLICWEGFAAAVSDTDAVPNAEWPDSAFAEMTDNLAYPTLFERPDLKRMSIDDLCARTGIIPTAITFDVEGAEFEVLKGAATTLADQRPLVWASIHPQFMIDYYQTQPIEIYRFMRALEYRDVFLNHTHEAHVVFVPAERSDFVTLP